MRENAIIDPKGSLAGIKYREEKPWSCNYCYWWGGSKSGCINTSCYYLIPKQKKATIPAQPGVCKDCPYGRASPCIGYCIDRLDRERRGINAGRSK